MLDTRLQRFVARLATRRRAEPRAIWVALGEVVEAQQVVHHVRAVVVQGEQLKEVKKLSYGSGQILVSCVRKPSVPIPRPEVHRTKTADDLLAPTVVFLRVQLLDIAHGIHRGAQSESKHYLQTLHVFSWH